MLSMCERFHCLPSQLDEEDASLIRLVNIADKGRKRREEGE